MLFSSMVFLWCFLPIVLAGYYLLDNRWRNHFLLLCSLIFYAWGEPRFIVLMLLSITVNYFAGLFTHMARPGLMKKLVVALSVAVNISFLGYFKYANFFVETINNVFPAAMQGFAQIALPIGISFYTFQAMSYVIDVYREECEVQKNPLRLGLFIAFFPQLIAGPIVKYHDIHLQLLDRKHSAQKVAYGIRRFVLGLAKKVLIANQMAMLADNIFEIRAEFLGIPLAWLGAVAYAFQIYYDFSGYSDMAIGLGSMFGFRFIENFNYPYLSKSIKEFWTRWHISLSTWFKEYLYIPLGGNRKGALRMYRNLILVFLVTGIWHGAAWTFLCWGIYHGLFLLFERIVIGRHLEKAGGWKILAHLYTILVFLCGWVLFRAETLPQAFGYLKAMFVPADTPYNFSAYFQPATGVLLLIALAFCGPVQHYFPKFRALLYDESRTRTWELVVLPILLAVIIVFLVANTYNPFIYFRF